MNSGGTGGKVTAHILDPQGGLANMFGLSDEEINDLGMSTAKDIYRTEQWTVGEDISPEEYRQLSDPETGDLYVLIAYQAGIRNIRAVPKELWNQVRGMTDV